MIKQILKILWKQRRSHLGIFIEQLLVTMVLMLATVSVAEMVKKYKTPGILNIDNTFFFGYMYSETIQPEEKEKIRQCMNIIIENLRKLPFVEAIGNSSNLVPYMKNDRFYYELSDSIYIDGKQFLTVIKISDEFGATVLKPEMEEGLWLENHDLSDGSASAVITRQFADKAKWTNAVGKKLTVKGRNYTVTGVVAGLKQEPFIPSPVAMVIPQYLSSQYNRNLNYESVARIKAGMEQEFIDAFYNEFQRLISDERVEPLLHEMQSMKGTWMSASVLEITLQSIPTVFLFIFAFIGTFGLSWMLSRRRLKEFALRIALGSTKKQLMNIVIGESLLITCIAMIPALLLSFFIYEYTIVHIIGISTTICIMLLFSIISAWYPAWKVSRVNPAEALQYE
jgi:ABC-type antimicrobial peptide transport system permease subunit